MTDTPLKSRVTRGLLLGVMVAASLGRAELGADTEASVLFTPAFGAALVPGIVAGFLAASRFGRNTLRGWVTAAGLTLLVLLLAALTVSGVAGVLGAGGAPALILLAQVVQTPFALGSLGAAWVVTQLLAIRQNR